MTTQCSNCTKRNPKECSGFANKKEICSQWTNIPRETREELKIEFRNKFPGIDEHSFIGKVVLKKLWEIREDKRKAKIGEIVRGGKIYDQYRWNDYEFEIERG